eukprot:5313835-Pleurochrysis_carterae.AAC.5
MQRGIARHRLCEPQLRLQGGGDVGRHNERADDAARRHRQKREASARPDLSSAESSHSNSYGI